MLANKTHVKDVLKIDSCSHLAWCSEKNIMFSSKDSQNKRTFCLLPPTISKSLWPPSDESPPPLALFQSCYNDVDFSFDIFLNLQKNTGQGVGRKGSHCPMLLSEIVESGWHVTRPNQGLSLGRGKSLGTRL